MRRMAREGEPHGSSERSSSTASSTFPKRRRREVEMLLQRLTEYADRLPGLPPPLYAETPIRYIIELDGAGRLLSPSPTDTADPTSPRTRRGTRRKAPEVQRSSAIRPLLLADKADYVLGHVADEK